MIVSWNWLKDYVALDISADELARRLMMAGLNHESTEPVGDDLAIDLEITSNRPDCLGHIGIAREAAALCGSTLSIPPAQAKTGRNPVSDLASVTIDAPELCARYTARVIRGARIAASPDWMLKRLRTVGVTPINNVVDITNYVMFECGQPLHAFDYQKLSGQRIIVRAPRAGEQIEAIDHKTYKLDAGMCVIADGERPLAIAGVMGGAATEVSPRTTDLLIEAAIFDPANIRATARRLALHSDSSYRFERGVDSAGVDWASRRCCELILELAGGELAEGVIDVGAATAQVQPIVLRLSQIKRVLGIEIPAQGVEQILTALGGRIAKSGPQTIEVVAPTWRRDVTREIDLVEEVARVHGYEQIPEDVQVPMVASARSRFDRVSTKTRQTMIGTGYDEAYTLSAVDEAWSNAFSPWSDNPALHAQTPVLRRAEYLRRSLVPSLLGARRMNESLANPTIELFEIAKIYLSQQEALPIEDCLLGIASGGDFLRVKGAIDALLAELHIDAELKCEPHAHSLFEVGRAARLTLGSKPFGFLGEISGAGKKQFELRGSATVAEVRMALLLDRAELIPQYARPPQYPAVERDLNLVVSEVVRWSELSSVVHQTAGPLLEELTYRDTYRDPERIGPGKKSLLFSIKLRDPAGTLTNEQADQVRAQIVAGCGDQFAGELRE